VQNEKTLFYFSLSIALLSVNMAFSQDGYKISGEVQYVGAKNKINIDGPQRARLSLTRK
jgi:hypothetical protein